MILVLKADITPAEVDHIIAALGEKKLNAARVEDSSSVCLALPSGRTADDGALLELPGVERVIRHPREEPLHDGSRRWYPHIVLQAVMAFLLTGMVLLALAIFAPSRIGSELNLLAEPKHLQPEWYLLASHFLFRSLPPWLVHTIGAVLWGLVLAIPLVDRRLGGVASGRQVAQALAIGVLGLLTVLSLLGYFAV